MKEAWNLRITPEQKKLFKEAARSQGRSLTNFTIFHLERAARQELSPPEKENEMQATDWLSPTTVVRTQRRVGPSK